MEMLRNIWVTSTASTSASQGSSLLADWNTYSSAGAPPSTAAAAGAGAPPVAQDVEAGGGSSSQLFSSAGTASAKVTGFLQNSFTTVSSGVSAGVTSVASGEAFSIPSGQQMVYFMAFMAGGAVFLLLAFMIFLPVIILSPSKFALSFTLGCLSIMAGFIQLRGWRTQMAHMMTSERLPYSAGYVGTVMATLYAALIMKSYLLSLLCSGLQVVALLYYLMSYFPGGAQGVKFMLGLFYKAAAQCLASVYAMAVK